MIAHDVGVVMSTDTDLVPVLEASLEIKTVGVHIEVAAGKRRAPTVGSSWADSCLGATSCTKPTIRRLGTTVTTTSPDGLRSMIERG